MKTKYKFATIAILSSISLFSQKKLYLNENISLYLNDSFKKLPTNIANLEKSNNEEFKNWIKGDSDFVFSQNAYNITNPRNPKSFINIAISKIILPESIENSSLGQNLEQSTFIASYLDNEVSKNFSKTNSSNAQLIQKNQLININGLKVFNCIIHTNLEARINDFLSTTSYIYYIFYNKELLFLSIDITDNEKGKWEIIRSSTINSLSVQN